MATHFLPIGVSERKGKPPLSEIPRAIELLCAYGRESFPDWTADGKRERTQGFWDYTAVEAMLDVRLRSVAASDTAIVYWAGHGLSGEGSHRLLLTDGHILTRQLVTWLIACPARTVLCIVDCCDAGTGVGEILAEAQTVRDQQGYESEENRTTTVIASARSEKSREGALVDAMLWALTHGPGPKVDAAHRWDRDSTHVAPADLLAAVSFRLADEELDQQPFSVNLRYSDVGRFFPSVWHGQALGHSGREVDPESRARKYAAEAFMSSVAALPERWTDAGLRAHAIVLAEAPGLSDADRRRLVAMTKALQLALAAESLASSLVDREMLTENILSESRRAAMRMYIEPVIDRQFDLFAELAASRVDEPPRRPIERLTSFVAGLAARSCADPDYGRLRVWAGERGLQSHHVNHLIEQAEAPAPQRRVMIDLRGERGCPGELPASVTAQVFEDSVVWGERLVEHIPGATLGELVSAVEKLLTDQRLGRYQAVDVVVPDELVLFDPAGSVKWPARRSSADLGSKVPVTVRFGSRFGRREDWARLRDGYRDLRDRCRVEVIDGWPDGGTLLARLSDPPPAVAFLGPAPAGPPPEALLDALDSSPIVVWYAASPNCHCQIDNLFEAHWPELPDAVAAARWPRLSTGLTDAWNTDTEAHHLRELRMVWEDDQWFRFAERLEHYGG